MPKGPRCVKVELTKGYVAVVDAADEALVSNYRWHAAVRPQAVYAGTNQWLEKYKQTILLMHRMVLGFPEGRIDHRDGDGLNNRRSNLRLASNAQNAYNQKPHRVANKTSIYKGVKHPPKRNRWDAQISVAGKTLHLGSFMTEEEAALAYDQAAVQYFGEYARLNFPEVN